MSAEKFLNSDRVYELWAKIKDAMAGKQDVITAGDGLSKEGDALGVETPVRGILTQEEFESLPEERRSKGLYIILEAGDLPSFGYEIYSLEETVAGVWIDGRPVYRMCIPFSIMVGGSSSASMPYDIDGIDTVVDIAGTYVIDGDPYYGTLGVSDCLCNASYNAERKYFTFTNRYSSSAIKMEGLVMIQYTKSTDKTEVGR